MESLLYHVDHGFFAHGGAARAESESIERWSIEHRAVMG